MKEGKLIKQIREAVKSGKLKEPFNPEDVKKACPGWADQTYKSFLPKHVSGPYRGYTQLFEKIGKNLYRLLPKK